ncbi:thioredoxin [Kocuria sp. CCUG 69068]|nr:DsbA family protein [Sediminivirga luteola]MCC5782018.1 thioredoxin [Kocuria sp. CCUG 69068]
MTTREGAHQVSTQVDVFVDYVCPFCFLVEGAVEELKRDRDVEVRIRPFELRPDPVPTLRPEDEYLPRVWKSSVYPMAERLGVDITLPSISPQPRTEKAFMVLQLAQEQGKAEEYTEAMFKAFFQDDRDIGHDAVIIEVALSVGLDRSQVEEALHSDQRRDRQRADQDYAVNTVGIEAVPGIVVEGQLLRGVPSATRLKKVVDQLTAQDVPPRPEP